GSGNLLAHYTYGSGLTSRVDAAGQAAYYDFGTLGSTAGLTDTAGRYMNEYQYLPFGERVASAEQLPNPFQFVGQFGVQVLPDGPVLMGARSYDSQLGRFLQQDPIGIEGGANLYSYVGNAPTDGIDPQGESDRCTINIVFAANAQGQPRFAPIKITCLAF